MLPDVQVTLPNQEVSDGVILKLSHGISIAWDGPFIRHCTTVTDVGDVRDKNRCFGTHFCESFQIIDPLFALNSN
jgi:hypothetical protein